MNTETINKGLALVKEIKQYGYEAYIVGGAVRDFVLKRKIKDIDIATNAPIGFIENKFETYSLGQNKKFGVVGIKFQKELIEISHFRQDKGYSDGRHPDSIELVSSFEEDVKRRDFTINALALNENLKIIDFVGGISDIKNKVLRFVGNPYGRIKDDKLRMLRLVRFARRFQFEIDRESYEAVNKNSSEVTQVSWERIRDELAKILVESDPWYTMDMLKDLGLLKAILPEIDVLSTVKQCKKYHPEGHVFTHTKKAMQCVEGLLLRTAALYHDVGKTATTRDLGNDKITAYGHDAVGEKLAYDALRRLKFDNKFVGQVVGLVKNHMRPFQVKQMKKDTLKRMFRDPSYHNLMALHRADLMASCGSLDTYNYACAKYEELSKEGFSPAPLLNGDDLIGLGYAPSKQFKTMLTEVESKQLVGKLKTKEEAVAYVLNKFPLE